MLLTIRNQRSASPKPTRPQAESGKTVLLNPEVLAKHNRKIANYRSNDYSPQRIRKLSFLFSRQKTSCNPKN